MDAIQLQQIFTGHTALVVGHPGHELRIHHWVERLQPRVSVLTDGSGRVGCSRIASTKTLLDRAGARPGEFFGRYTDRQFYAALIERNTRLFIDIAQELADDFVAHNIRCVIGDAYEGYNPTHDVCRLIIGVATFLAERRMQTQIVSYAFPLAADPRAALVGHSTRRTNISAELTDEAFARKLEAAQNYPELSGELAAAAEKIGLIAFRTECLSRVDECDGQSGPHECPPYYEQYGEQQVAQGHYQSVIRYETHVRELATACRAVTQGAA